VEASAPKYGASYGSIQRFLFAIEGLLPLENPNIKECGQLFHEFKPFYHNRLNNGCRINI